MATTTSDKQKTNGASANKADEIVVENPATGQVVATLPAATPDDVAAMADRARNAQPAWHALGFAERGRILSRFQKWMCDNADRILDTEMSESGKTREDCVLEFSLVVSSAGFWPKSGPKYLRDEKVKTSSPFLLGRKVIVRYEPVGVASIIGPWNYPLANNIGDVFPALMAGNTVLLKPSSVTPLSSVLMAEGLHECGCPKDVFQVVVGRGAIGETMIDHSDFVMFTGSTETGKTVMERASKTLTPVSLELGGKDPMIVCADADIDRAANAAVFWSMQNAGQTCISVERCYVEESIHDRFIEMVGEKARALRQGVPGEFGSVDVGSFINPPQIEIVEAHVNDAVKKGARVLAGGHRREGEGTFYEPTILVDVDHTMECMTEETFGPTLPIMKVRDSDEAIRLANDSPYGLQASVFTKDIAKGEAIARKLQAGAVVVNDCVANYSALEAPMGGWKTSGMGVRHGPEGIRKYTHRQTILLSKWVMKKDLYMFPYSKRTSDFLLKLIKFLYGRGDRG
ncbi:MAG TPA: succinic semialdehyde dehydrogenase [Solirubrobacteraceae bacterium]|nr:succinic semialdehyde dehydrogenase [Solirubrobacteraceae bacterium]